jgi:predicted Zn-dependent peptidase
MYDDNAGARLYYELLSLLYHNHNIKINICGTVHSIAQITPEVLYKCYNTFYNLSNMALVICGDLEVEDIQKITSKVLKPQKAIDIVCQYPEEPKAIAKKSSVFKMHVANKIFSIGIKDVNFSEDKIEQKKRSFAVNIINELVFSSSSKFYNYLYNNGFIKQHLSAEYEYLKNCAHNIITGESDTPEQVFDLYKKEISKLKKNFPSEQDFDRIKLVMYSDYIRAFDSTEDIANTFVDCVFSGIDILDLDQIILDIDYEYVQNLFTELFDEEFTAYTVIEPYGEEV